MKKSKIKKSSADPVDPDHFTVFELKEGWEIEASKYNSLEQIEAFKKREELLRRIPTSMRRRTKKDKSYREGWIDAAGCIQKEIDRIFSQKV